MIFQDMSFKQANKDMTWIDGANIAISFGTGFVSGTAKFMAFMSSSTGKKIMKDKNAITKDEIKEYLFFKVRLEIVRVKVNAKKDKIKLSKVDMRKCIWVCFQRYKLLLDDYKINLNMEDENNFLDEYLTLKI